MADDVTLPGSGVVVATDDIGSGRQVQLVKPVYGADGSATMVAADAGLPVTGGYAVLTGSASANSTDLISTAANGFQVASVTLTGTFSATVAVQGSNDNTNWVTLLGQSYSSGSLNSGISSVSSTSSALVVPISLRYIRVRTTSYSSGTVNATLYLHNSAFSGLVADTRLAATTLGQNDGTLSGVAAIGMAAIGSTSGWDRWRANFNDSTGDSGAKTGNFLGATQTNFNARGAYITLSVGATSGTFTTFQTGLQWSPDGVSTWLPLTGLGANLTTPANGDKIVWHVYPGAGSVTPAGSGGVSEATQYNYADAALPRNWRFAMTIAGSTPSLTISSIRVNYIV